MNFLVWFWIEYWFWMVFKRHSMFEWILNNQNLKSIAYRTEGESYALLFSLIWQTVWREISRTGFPNVTKSFQHNTKSYQILSQVSKFRYNLYTHKSIHFVFRTICLQILSPMARCGTSSMILVQMIRVLYLYCFCCLIVINMYWYRISGVFMIYVWKKWMVQR